MGLEYFIPVPVGLFIFMCAVCLRLTRASDRGGLNRRRRRVIIIRSRTQTTIPSQFESPGAPIITSEEGYPQRPEDFPPTYDDAQRYYQWQQQQSLQHPPQQGAYVKAMHGWSQPQQQPDEATGENPTQGIPPPPGQIQQPGDVTGAPEAQVNPPSQPGLMQQPGDITGAPQVQVNPPPYPGLIQPGVVTGNNGAASTGLLLDVTSLPCASAQSPPSQSAN